MSAVEMLFFVLAMMGTLYYILSGLALISHFKRRFCGSETPEISVLKPISGLDAGAEKNLQSILTQNYPDYEVIFGVLDMNDLSVPVIKKAVDKHPQASLFLGSEAAGMNNKVKILCSLMEHASGEIIVITDADTRPTADFLNAVAAPFSDASVGMVTCMYRGICAKTVSDMLEGLHMTCIFAPGVALAEAISGINFGLGAAIAIRRSALEDIGGFEAISDYLADDFQLGRKTAKAGYKVVLSDYVIDIVLSGESLRNTLARELRWSRTTRICRPSGHFGLIFTFGFAYSMFFLFASGFSLYGWLTVFCVMAVRMLTASAGALKLGDREFGNRVFLLPLRDFLSFIMWIIGYFSNRVKWRGRMLIVRKNGKMAGF